MNDTTTYVAPNSLLFVCFCHRQDPINIEEKNTLSHHDIGSLEILDTLLARNGLSRTLPGACIRFSSLTTNRKPSTMPEAAIALNLTKPADILSDLTPKRTLYLAAADRGGVVPADGDRGIVTHPQQGRFGGRSVERVRCGAHRRVGPNRGLLGRGVGLWLCVGLAAAGLAAHELPRSKGSPQRYRASVRFPPSLCVTPCF